ncbi:peroxidase-like isoform X2 [Schistocerca serialis cubense]|nr:peroxidase-like isoform X2 [Schistocerca serialis cubense]
MTEERKTIKELVLSEYFNAPSIIIKKFEELLIGAVTHSSRKEDENFDREIADELFRPNRTTFGMSLPGIDIQRARDHGVPPYNDLREKCGLPRANDFGDLIDTTPYPAIVKMKKVYKHVDDIDPIVGGALENNIPGTLMGPTFLCLMVNQFLLSQKSDRFFYLNRKQEYPFTEGQIKEIKKASIARLMCDHTGVQKIQKQAFLQISKRNSLVDCRHIPAVDLSAWKEKWNVA